MSFILTLFALVFGVMAVVFLGIYVLLPMVKGIGWLVMGFFRAVGWTIAHLFEFVAGTIGDVFRFVSSSLAILVLTPLTLLTVALGRWSAAGHFARSVRRELATAGTCLYRVGLRRPLKLVWLHGLLEGIEQRVPEAIAAAPGKDAPSRRHRFDGYTIVGSLAAGGSGAKLYIAEPDAKTRGRIKDMPERVVIKSFTLEEGSMLPQIVRESRALESAKRIGAVYEHGMDDSRFWYAMPYHAGDHLGIFGRDLHARAGEGGLEGRGLRDALKHVTELAATLHGYHLEGLWHKDVKPENIIVTREGAKLVDLGLVTPLKSAMTLTTHGTEYFRDPELVRQALKGVKVHEVDGAKFDVFGIGAVLYYLIENDFPAHGPLSRFGKRSPDAIKWIIRRAMADYAHRYPSAAAMLADLDVVANAADPFAVRPGDLPSVSDEVSGDVSEDAVVDAPVGSPADADAGSRIAGAARGLADAVVAAAAAAVPPKATPPSTRPPVGAGAGVAAGRGAGQKDDLAGRPRIVRAGFFTGAYRAVDADSAGTGAAGVASIGGAGKVADASVKNARQQIKDARKKVRGAQARTRRTKAKGAGATGRHRRSTSRSPWLDALSVVFVMALIGGGVLLASEDARDGLEDLLVGRNYQAQHDHDADASANGDAGIPVAIVVYGEGADLAGATVDQVRRRYASGRFDLVPLPEAVDDRLEALLARWVESGDDADDRAHADLALETMLETYGLYGVQLVTSEGDAKYDMVYSTREQAEDRITNRILFDLPSTGRAIQLINDHADRANLDVIGRIDAFVAQLEANGWDVSRDGEREADLRTLLPQRSDVVDVPMTDALARKFDEHRIAAILRVISDPSDDDRVLMQVITPDEAAASSLPQPLPMLPVSPAVPAPPAVPHTGLLHPDSPAISLAAMAGGFGGSSCDQAIGSACDISADACASAASDECGSTASSSSCRVIIAGERH
ncbi:MAG: serine/threonine protein kinase [Phycisphaerales bacterium]